jgi:hypothetical protein
VKRAFHITIEEFAETVLNVDYMVEYRAIQVATAVIHTQLHLNMLSSPFLKRLHALLYILHLTVFAVIVSS